MSEHSPLAELARVQDAMLKDSSRVDRVRRRLELTEFAPAPTSSPRRKNAYVAATGLAIAIAAAAVVGIFVRSEAPIAFEVDGVRGEPRAPLAATEHGLELRFSDGSSAVLARGGAATVQRTEERGAHLKLSRGRIDLRIRPRPDTEWSVTAGEVRVVVHGTRFAVERVGVTTSVEVFRGLVEVVPPNAPSVWLHDGESYTYPVPTSSARDPGEDRDDGASALAASAEESRASAPPLEHSAEESPEAAPRPARTRRELPAREPPPTEVRSYETLVRAGLFDEALERARRRGLDDEIRRLPRTELLALGDAARFAGASTLARRVYVAVRRRFARTHESAMASFAMGRICADRLRRPRCAAENFEAYLHEAPNGPLASDALARLIEARRDGGDLAGARAAARRYLDRYPRGQRRDMARRTLEP